MNSLVFALVLAVNDDGATVIGHHQSLNACTDAIATALEAQRRLSGYRPQGAFLCVPVGSGPLPSQGLRETQEADHG